VGKLDPTDKEISLLSKMFLEAARHKGTEVTIQLVDKENSDRTFQNDPNYAYFQEHDIDLILDERPDVKVLKSLNWYNEEDELLPILGYISLKDINDEHVEVLKGTKVKLPFKLVGNEMERDYQIEEVKFSSYYVWVCKLVPDREEPDYEEDVSTNADQDTDFTFLKKDN